MKSRYKDWLTVEYPGVVAFCKPPTAEHQLIDDDSTICVTFNGTDVLASLFPVRQSLTASLESLELELRDFTHRCVRSTLNVETESYSRPVDVDFRSVVCCQAVLTIRSDRVWIARAYAQVGGNTTLLIHWNGDTKTAISFALPLFVSLVPLFALSAVDEC